MGFISTDADGKEPLAGVSSADVKAYLYMPSENRLKINSRLPRTHPLAEMPVFLSDNSGYQATN